MSLYKSIISLLMVIMIFMFASCTQKTISTIPESHIYEDTDSPCVHAVFPFPINLKGKTEKNDRGVHIITNQLSGSSYYIRIIKFSAPENSSVFHTRDLKTVYGKDQIIDDLPEVSQIMNRSGVIFIQSDTKGNIYLTGRIEEYVNLREIVDILVRKPILDASLRSVDYWKNKNRSAMIEIEEIKRVMNEINSQFLVGTCPGFKKKLKEGAKDEAKF